MFLSVHPATSVVDKLQAWLKDPRQVSKVWLGTPCVIAAWLGLFLAVVSRPDGIGVSLCWVYNSTGIPCLGCGLTRSLSCALRGLFAESWAYHPFGIPLLLLFLATAAQSVSPRRFRNRVKSHLEARAVACNTIYAGFVVLFVAYGVGRALARLTN